MTYDDEPVGSLADETARLVAALTSLARDHAPAGQEAAPPPDDPSDPSDPSSVAGEAPAAGETRHTTDKPPAQDAPPHTAHDHATCPTCGGGGTGGGRGASGGPTGRDPVCRICPICRGIDLLRRISPDTIEQVASFAGFVAEALKDIADAQRAAAAPTPWETAGSQPPRDPEDGRTR